MIISCSKNVLILPWYCIAKLEWYINTISSQDVLFWCILNLIRDITKTVCVFHSFCTDLYPFNEKNIYWSIFSSKVWKVWNFWRKYEFMKKSGTRFNNYFSFFFSYLLFEMSMEKMKKNRGRTSTIAYICSFRTEQCFSGIFGFISWIIFCLSWHKFWLILTANWRVGEIMQKDKLSRVTKCMKWIFSTHQLFIKDLLCKCWNSYIFLHESRFSYYFKYHHSSLMRFYMMKGGGSETFQYEMQFFPNTVQ